MNYGSDQGENAGQYDGGGYASSLPYIDNSGFVKAVLMIIVIIYHSIVFWGGEWFAALKPESIIVPIKYIAKWMNSFHVYTFVFTSGYIYSYLRYEKGKYQKFFPFLQNKAKRLLVPYLFVALLWVIPIGQYFFHSSYPELFKQYALGTGPSQLWFLLMLFDVFVISWFISDIIHNSVIAPVILSIIFYFGGYLGSHFLPNYYMIWVSFLYMPIFVLGMKLRECHYNGRLCEIKITGLLCLVILDIGLFIINQVFSNNSGLLFRASNTVIELLLHATGGLMAFFTLQFVAKNTHWKDKPIISDFSKMSMTFYLFHQQIIYLSIACLNGQVNPYVIMICNLVAALVVSYLLAKLLMKFKYTRFLIGEK